MYNPRSDNAPRTPLPRSDYVDFKRRRPVREARPPHLSSRGFLASDFSRQTLRPPTPMPLSSVRPLVSTTTRASRHTVETSRGQDFSLNQLVPWFMVGAAILLFVGGSLVAIDGFRTNQKVAAQTTKIDNQVQREAQADIVSSSTATNPANDQPSKPLPATPYAVAADQPKFIDIARLGMHGRIKAVGLEGSAIAVPKNTNYAGWYNGSSKPGEIGAAVLVGHVSSYASNGGIFGPLKKLSQGDTLTVTMGDGRVFTYRVEVTKTYDKDAVDMTAVMMPTGGAKSGINLVTCTGKYNSKTETYDQRLVVFATQQ